MIFYYKKIFLLLLVIVMNGISAKRPTCISLGSACCPALNLRALNLRSHAYPFDWVVSPFESLYKALQEDFRYFLSDIKIREDRQGVLDYYGIHFTHDWPTMHQPNIDALHVDMVGNCTLYPEWEKALPLVQSKYQRRIKRLHEACTSNERVYLIRAEDITQDQAIVLSEFFKNKYPQLDFTLIVFKHDESFKNPWNIENIRNLYLHSWDNAFLFGESLKLVSPDFKDIKVVKHLALLEPLSCLYCMEEDFTQDEGALRDAYCT